MRLALVSDAWAPQVNGVVRTLAATVAAVRARGHVVETLTPDRFRTIACPTYPEIRLAIGCAAAMRDALDGFAPDAVHIATEGPLGWAARRWCLRGGMPFTTSFHTRFPEYLAMRTGAPAAWFWPLVRRFHQPAARIMAATATLRHELSLQGLGQTHLWSRGVDLDLFGPDRAPPAEIAGLPGPIQLYVGRVAVEKNIEAFLATNTPGSKIVVGDGPALAALRIAYPAAHFLGARHGAELAACYAAADVFVFPSRTDTFGLVMIEALASGTPVAALPVPGPLDIVGLSGSGVGGRAGARIGAIHEDLGKAIGLALSADRAACAAEGRRYSWATSTAQFIAGLAPVAPEIAAAA